MNVDAHGMPGLGVFAVIALGMAGFAAVASQRPAVDPHPPALNALREVCAGKRHWPHPIKPSEGKFPGTHWAPMSPPPSDQGPEPLCGFGADLYRKTGAAMD